jgi:hypothetical protein
LAIHAGERSAVDVLLGGSPVAVATLPLGDEAEAVAFAQRLLLEGVLVVQDPAESQR